MSYASIGVNDLAVEKTFILTIENPETGGKQTLFMQRFIDHEMIPKFEVSCLDGEYATRTEFFDAFEEYYIKASSGEETDKRFDLITFYPADFRRFIETCESLEKAAEAEGVKA